MKNYMKTIISTIQHWVLGKIPKKISQLEIDMELGTKDYNELENTPTKLSEFENDLTQFDSINLNLKMDKENPTGTGSFSLNRKPNTTVGNYSFAEGNKTTASGISSHAEGNTTTASGANSHAEGYGTTASGFTSHAEGYNTKATSTDDTVSSTSFSTNGEYTHAEGYGTVAYGSCSHAEGNGTKASGSNSHAEGYKTTASGNESHAEGNTTTASGGNSHAEGNGTKASGSNSHAEGYGTTVSGDKSHAEGYYTKASSDYQHVQGKYNIEDTANTYSHIVGNGTSSSKRSNAHTLDWKGNAWYQGTVETTAIILSSSTEGSTKRFKITVDDSGTLTVTEITE